ncbi:unnamed protein product [Soboliphyme baturini]|uniref:HCO3_cotransp domain-containing protein n=1 Tax=Soboliphyme baturini TaxID=241478 RepID=A0A183J9J2_9BILA|nr:unnamed protein product [Soboliphyme baturini]
MGSMDIAEEQKLRRTGRLFGGLREDLRIKASWYRSDFVDAFKGRISQIVAASIFLFFANVSKMVTFGGVMDHVLHKQMGTIENLLSGAFCGIVFALFAGQPLCILSATGPCLVFETIIFQLCESQGWEFLVVRFWVGLWTAVFVLLLVAMDASVMVAWITRFTEEAFATLISLIYVIKAVQELMMIAKEAPMMRNLNVSFKVKKVILIC